MSFGIIIIDVAFWVLLAAGIYLEKLTWDKAFVYGLIWLAILFAFKIYGWPFVVRGLPVLVLDLVLVLTVFEGDLVLPNWWFRRF